MAQTIRLTITPELEKALEVLRKSTSGTLNTTELVKFAVGALANSKMSEGDREVQEESLIGAYQFHRWAKDDGTLEVDNISPNAKLKSYVPEPYVPNS